MLPACSSRDLTVDPVKVQAEIDAYREQELLLVRETVADRERSERLIGLLGERDRRVADYAREISQFRGEMAKLNADYDARREDFDELLAGFNSRRLEVQKEWIDLISAMKATTTSAEWKVISRFQTKRLDPRHLTYSQADAG